MRIFAIRDESLPAEALLGYLIYYPQAKAFYIELPEDADPWKTPLLLSSFAKRGEHSVGSYWSRLWVQQRIIPQDRQNLGQILRENGLEIYDEFQLLMLSMGRCAQDDCYLEEIPVGHIPPLLLDRWKVKVEEVVPLKAFRLLVFFRNGEVKVVDIPPLAGNDPAFSPYLSQEKHFSTAEVQPDGYGVHWSDRAALSAQKLYAHGELIPLELEDFIGFVRHRVVSSHEASQILGCSRQNIDDLVRRDKLHPIRRDAKNRLFLRNEVVQRKQHE